MSMTRKEAQFGQPNDSTGSTGSSNPPLLPPVISDEEAEMPVPLEQLRPAVYPSPGDGPVALIHYSREPGYPNDFQHVPNSDTDFDSKVAYEDVRDIQSRKKAFQEQSATRQKSCNSPLFMLFCLVAVTFLMAAGALAIAVYGFISPQGDSEITELRQQVADLSAMVESLEYELVVGRIEQLESELATVSDTLSAIVNPRPDGGNSSVTNVTISRDLLLYENCTTTLLEICPVETDLLTAIPSFNKCTTENYPLHLEGEYTLNINCAILDSRDEQNPATTSVKINEKDNQFSCTCYVTVNNNLLPRDGTVDCGLYVTRCPKVYTFEL